MLQKIYNTDDVVFGSIISGRSAAVQGNNQMTGGFVNAFPVRLKSNSDELFSDLVKRIRLQILESQENAHFSPDEIGERLGKKLLCLIICLIFIISQVLLKNQCRLYRVLRFWVWIRLIIFQSDFVFTFR